MTEQQPTEPAANEITEAAATEAKAEAKDEDEEKDEEKDEEDEDEEKDEDEKKSKKKKKKKKDEEKDDESKKVKIEFEGTMPRNEAVSYFEAIVGGLRSGRLEFKQADKTLVLSPPDHLEIEVKAQAKGDKGRIVFEIEWSDEHRPLEISN